jgi:hypothetical protein
LRAACGGLDRCDEAVAEGKRAVELLPESRDSFDGPILAVTRARISVHCRDYTTALDLIERSLGIPAGITVAELQRDLPGNLCRTSRALSK